MDIKRSWLFDRPIAHRGLHSESVPENSLSAFKRAIEHGYPIELDVRPIDDGSVIVFHDDSLKRMTNSDGYACNLTKESISKIHLKDTDEKIPFFSEVLELVNGKTPILIEIKNEGTVGALEKSVLSLLSSYEGEYAVQSFNPFSMEYFKKHAPHIARGQLASWFKKGELSFIKRYLLSRLKLNGASAPDFISYRGSDLPNKFVKKTHLPVLAWTARTQADFDEYKQHSNNIIFEGFIPEIK